MTKKQIVCCIGFILSACVVLYLLCDLFELKNTNQSDKRFNSYRSLNDDTVDAVVIGTSGIDRYWIASKAYDEYGMTVYPLASNGQAVWLYDCVLEEAYAYQEPKLLIVDMRAFGQENTDEVKVDVRARTVLDSLTPLSANRIRAGFKTMKLFHDNFEDKPRFDISYLLSVVKYHEEWKDEEYSITQNLFGRKHDYLGFYINKKLSIRQRPQEIVVYDPEYREPLDPISEQAFYDLLDYVKTKDAEVLFVLTPKFSTTTEMGRMNTLVDMLEKEGQDYVNYCETDESGNFLYDLQLNPETDFYNKEHTNYYGAEKFTRVFSAYLDENYDLPDRREDSAVKEQWDGVYKKVQKRIRRIEKNAEESKE